MLDGACGTYPATGAPGLEPGGDTRGMDTTFPGAGRYQRLCRGPDTLIREAPRRSPRFAYTERHIQCVWFDPELRPDPLQTVSGESVTVVDPGRWNLEAGPDFLDAALVIGPRQRHLRGDVEVHVHPGDWMRHKHSRDPAYARVVAHLTYFPGVVPRDQFPGGGVQIPLKPNLDANPMFSFDAVDTASYPYAAPHGTPHPCTKALTTWPPPDRATLLESAGEERLRIKSARLADAMQERGPDQVLYEELMAALGFKRNQAAFRLLARRVPAADLRSESEGDVDKAYALLLGVAGQLPATFPEHWDRDTRAFVRGLWNFWWKRKSEWEHACMPPEAWTNKGIRPQNRPVRRLAAAACLFGGSTPAQHAVRNLDISRPEVWLEGINSLFRTTGSQGYWKRRLTLGGKLQKTPVALVGSGRLPAMVTNAVVPVLAAEGKPVTGLLKALPAEQNNTLVRQTAFSLFGRDHNPALYRSGLRQQGLLQIFYDFCLHNKTGCRDCHLAAALATQS